MTPTLIESSSVMDELVLQLSKEKVIAVDTEFFRETTYYPKLALIQIATDSIVACVDPLAFDAKPALKQILCNKEIIKIFHACSQDLEVLFYYLGEIPAPIYDTQIANALLTNHHQIGYAALVENELAVQLDKSQTRTNWLQRPLTDKQIQYAGDDVLYLYRLQHLLDKKLRDTERRSWFDEDSEQLSAEGTCFQVDASKLWRRVKGATKLDRKKLATVQAIALWREELAQQNDLTRRRALPDDIVIQLALNPTEDIDTLAQIIPKHLNISVEKQQQLLAAMKTAQQSSENSWPDNRFTVLDGEQKLILKSLQQLIVSKADELDISSAILCSRKDLEQLIITTAKDTTSPDQTKSLITRGWRLQCIGQDLLKTLKDQ